MQDTNKTHLRIGTRGSQLALWQSHWVAQALKNSYPDLVVEIIEIKTHGDRDRNSPLATIGGTGLFTKEIQHALLEKRVDIAVHSLKDLPTLTPQGLCLAAVPEREDVRDVLIAPTHKTLANLPEKATVGTGSLRRRAMLLHVRPDLNVVGLRGNVETRLNYALNKELDAVVLAGAGLNRLGFVDHITEYLSLPHFLPAVGQGALGIEAREDDLSTRKWLEALDHSPSRAAVTAERAALRELEGGCQIPLGAFAVANAENQLTLHALVLDPDGHQAFRSSLTGTTTDPETLGIEVARDLLNQGAGQVLGRN